MLAGRGGDVPIQHPDEREPRPPDSDVEEVPDPEPDPNPEPDSNPEPAPSPKGTVPKRGRPRLTKEDILRRLPPKAKVTSTPRTRTTTRGTREGPSPLTGVDISSLIKVPTFPAPMILETAELGAKA